MELQLPCTQLRWYFCKQAFTQVQNFTLHISTFSPLERILFDLEYEKEDTMHCISHRHYRYKRKTSSIVVATKPGKSGVHTSSIFEPVPVYASHLPGTPKHTQHSWQAGQVPHFSGIHAKAMHSTHIISRLIELCCSIGCCGICGFLK